MYWNTAVSADGGKNWKLIKGQCENDYLRAAEPFMPVVYATTDHHGLVALNSEPYLELPRLGAAVDAAGNPTETETAFSSGVSVNSGEFQRKAVITAGESVVVEGAIETDKKDIEKTADILAAIIYTPSSPQDNAVRQVFMFDGKNKLIPLDMTSYSISSLPAFQRDVALSSFHTVKLFEGKFNRAGRMELYFG
ncbi:MAG: hypothetical protein GY862_14915, partial [Gammaproteobacteria bacterium]|nr:hypothetical protein [Gammaproteobacteria bacterium]